MTNWSKRKVLVTGGAGFIGSNLVDALLCRGAEVAVVDKLLIPSQQNVWEKKVSRLHEIYAKYDTYPQTFIIDLALDKERFQLLAEDYDTVFHLSAVFGGREFVDVKQAECSVMLAIDHNVIDASYQAGVKHVHYASSACVYPPWMQFVNSSPLKETDTLMSRDVREEGKGGRSYVGEWYELSDNLYGWCVAGDTRVITSEGLKKIMHVSPADQVLGKDGLWHRVKEICKRPLAQDEHVALLKPSRGLPFVVTNKHLTLTSTGWERVENLIPYTPGRLNNTCLVEPLESERGKNYEDRLKFRYRGYKSCILLDNDFWRLIGFWVAEGSLEKHTGTFANPGYITIAQKDYPTLKRYEDIVKRLDIDPDVKINAEANGMHIMRMWHEGLWKWLRDEFTTRLEGQPTTRDKTAPLTLSALSDIEFRAFFEGWNEGDGAHESDPARQSVRVGTSSPYLAGRMYIIMRTRGINTSLSVSYPKIGRAAYRIAWLGSQYQNNVLITPSSYRPLFVYDLEVEGEDSYALPGCILHNSKLMGELQLKRYHIEKGLSTSTCRYLTVYGWGEFDASHAIAALTQKALRREDPYVVWGSGNQERGFTYVTDIVDGSILASETINDATPINLGTDKRYKIRDVAKQILSIVDHKPKEILYDTSKPEGPFSRALDISLAEKVLGWFPKVALDEGLQLSVDWHRSLNEIRK